MFRPLDLPGDHNATLHGPVICPGTSSPTVVTASVWCSRSAADAVQLEVLRPTNEALAGGGEGRLLEDPRRAAQRADEDGA